MSATNILANAYVILGGASATPASNILKQDAIGTKEDRNAFITVVSGAVSGGNSVVSGVRPVRESLNAAQGEIYSTENMPSTFFAVSGGDGWAIVLSEDSPEFMYTRLTDFIVKEDGSYRNSANQKLCGIEFDDLGNLPSGGITVENLKPVKVSDLNAKAVATRNVEISMRIPAVAPTTNPSFSSIIYDSLGIAHTANFTLTRTGANAWTIAATITGGNITAPGGPVPITFNPDGTLATVNGNNTGNLDFTFDFSAGGASNAQLVTLNMGTPGLPKGIVQAGNDPTGIVFSQTQDGSKASSPLSNELDENGILATKFKESNSIKPRWQIPLAHFRDSNSLGEGPGSAKIETQQSGNAVLQVPGTGSAGVLVPKHLERSTADKTRNLIELTGLLNTNSIILSALSKSIAAEGELTSRL